MRKKYIRKLRRYSKRRFRPTYSLRDDFFVREHPQAFGAQTDVVGTDGKTLPILFSDFRNVVDCAGMYASFRVLAVGLE